MDSYKIIATDFEQTQLDNILEYIRVNLWNPDAADRVYEDAVITGNHLENAAESFGFCVDDDLRRLGYRKLLFDKHDYVFIYRVVDDTAIVEAVYHQSQDYENIFAEDIGIR